jgi:hypothetical protein
MVNPPHLQSIQGSDQRLGFPKPKAQSPKRVLLDSFECAIHAIAPRCAHCDCHVIGHGVEVDGEIHCCAHCATHSGAEGVKDALEVPSPVDTPAGAPTSRLKKRQPVLPISPVSIGGRSHTRNPPGRRETPPEENRLAADEPRRSSRRRRARVGSVPALHPIGVRARLSASAAPAHGSGSGRPEAGPKTTTT